jgi:hypothetical protein
MDTYFLNACFNIFKELIFLVFFQSGRKCTTLFHSCKFIFNIFEILFFVSEKFYSISAENFPFNYSWLTPWIDWFFICMLNKELPVLIGAANVTQFFYSPNIFSNIFHFFFWLNLLYRLSKNLTYFLTGCKCTRGFWIDKLNNKIILS